ncbi:synaptosomal associated protein 29 [Echinococcus multilocularis]|uniref:Synaptosomal associated protein 29 n=1 Tax=Echinococcus multilocularis TaxID=6211 RepID=A0A068Y1J5_ECHMU|nr:synaptosomal associated protein 29 [Echinococcus multilocularis]
MSKNPFDEEPSSWYSGPHTTNHFDRKYANCDNNLAFATPQSRTLASQQRALDSMSHSEHIGISTLEELSEQGEKLDRAERRLQQIGELQKDSQKSVNALNSWWRGWFSKKSAPGCTAEPTKVEAAAPVTRTQPAPAASYLSQNARSVPPPSSQSFPQSQTTQPRSQFDVNMDLMSSGMARLRDMATAMNAELKAQNQQLDRMEPALSSVSDTMTAQNRQMKTLLGVKSSHCDYTYSSYITLPI